MTGRSPLGRTLTWWHFVATILAGLALLVNASVPAVAEDDSGTAAISGRVTTLGGLPLEDAIIEVYRMGAIWDRVAQTTSDHDGRYTIDGLSAGTYQLRFLWRWDSNTWIVQWTGGYRNQVDAQSFDVGAGQAVIDQDARLTMPASISGRVTGEDGRGLAGVEVWAGARGAGEATTDHNGDYTIAGMWEGTYHLRFSPGEQSGYLEEWWNGQPSRETAEAVVVDPEAQLRGLDVQLTRGATVSGVVTDLRGNALSNVGVRIYRASDGAFTGYAATTSTGEYRVTALRPGEYTAQFYLTEPGFIPHWWKDSLDEESATVFTVAVGENLSGFDMRLGPLATISGRVTNQAGEGVSRVWVVAHGARHSDGVSTDENGDYTITRLRPDSYQLWFLPPDSSYLPESWKDARLDSGEYVVVALGDTVVGVDAQLDPPASISGRVSTTDGVNRGRTWVGICIKAEAPQNCWSIQANDDGSYQIKDLRANTYIIGFRTTDNRYAASWWKSADGYSGATPIVVAAGADVTGVDGKLSLIETEPQPLRSAVPTISGTRSVGSTLTAKPGVWTSGATFSYQWYANDKAISEATASPTLRLTKSHQGKKISVKVTGRMSGYTTASSLSQATAKVALTATPKISGKAKVGSTLKVKRGTWTSKIKFSYRWYADGRPIPKATKATLKLGKSLKGRRSPSR